MSKDVLFYVGEGRLLVGVPAVDLDPDELEATATRLNQTAAVIRKRLLESGLYIEKKDVAKPPEK